jgi:hypothetical protein
MRGVAIAFFVCTLAFLPHSRSLAGEGNQNTMTTPSAPEAGPPKAASSTCTKSKKKRIARLQKQIARQSNAADEEKLKQLMADCP